MQTIEVKVKPNSRQSSLDFQDEGTWLTRIKSPPVDGKANKELISLGADQFGVAKSNVSNVSNVSIRIGASGRLKLVMIDQL